MAPCCPRKAWLFTGLVVIFVDARRKHKNKSFHGCGGQVEANKTEGISGEGTSRHLKEKDRKENMQKHPLSHPGQLLGRHLNGILRQNRGTLF